MDLESKVVYQNGRSAVLEIVDGGIYDTKENYEWNVGWKGQNHDS